MSEQNSVLKVLPTGPLASEKTYLKKERLRKVSEQSFIIIIIFLFQDSLNLRKLDSR